MELRASPLHLLSSLNETSRDSRYAVVLVSGSKEELKIIKIAKTLAVLMSLDSYVGEVCSPTC